jgi:uroporphyrinogen decarboxylase
MNDLFLRACRCERVERTPLWLMRQAGRSLPEYRALRERHTFATLLREPELAAEVTIQPVDRLDVDAAILFSDILVPAAPLGIDVDFRPGPVIERPLRSARDVAALADDDPEQSVPWVFETIRILRQRLAGRVPLIGFAASPFTLAAYLVEGGGSKSFEHTMALVYNEPDTARRLLAQVAVTTERYVLAQVRAGAQAIQLFDTWAGLLDRHTFRELDLPFVRRIFDRLAGTGIPRIYFALHAAHLLPEIRACGADVVGVDWRTGLAEAALTLGDGFALQGNLDPAVLLALPSTIEAQARRILDDAHGLPGHVFNLGHGVLPATPVEHLLALVRAVRRGLPGPAERG